MNILCISFHMHLNGAEDTALHREAFTCMAASQRKHCLLWTPCLYGVWQSPNSPGPHDRQLSWLIEMRILTCSTITYIRLNLCLFFWMIDAVCRLWCRVKQEGSAVGITWEEVTKSTIQCLTNIQSQVWLVKVALAGNINANQYKLILLWSNFLTK